MSAFDKYKNQTNQEVSQGMKFFTGLAACKILAINPDQKRLGELIGEQAAEKFGADYSKGENLNGTTVRPVNIWVTDVDEKVSPTLLTINVNPNVGVTSKAGTPQNINKRLQTIYMSEEDIREHPKMKWYSMDGFRQAKVGEEQLYTLIAMLLRWDFDGKVDFLEMVKETECSLEDIWNGNYKGLHNLVNHCNENQFAVILPFAVKQQEKDDRIVTRQQVISNPDVWYRVGESHLVTQRTKDNFLNKHLKQNKEGYSLSKSYYTVEFQEFDKDACLNSEPDSTADVEDVAAASSSWI